MISFLDPVGSYRSWGVKRRPAVLRDWAGPERGKSRPPVSSLPTPDASRTKGRDERRLPLGASPSRGKPQPRQTPAEANPAEANPSPGKPQPRQTQPRQTRPRALAWFFGWCVGFVTGVWCCKIFFLLFLLLSLPFLPSFCKVQKQHTLVWTCICYNKRVLFL